MPQRSELPSDRVAFRPSAVVFDLDGVLIYSLGLWRAAQKNVANELGYAWSQELASALHGADHRTASALIAKSDSDEVGIVEAISERVLRNVTRGIGNRVALADGARELVVALAAAKIPLGVASNSPLFFAEECLRRFELDRYMATVVTAEYVSSPKPNPSIYLEASRRLGIAPAKCWALEDSSYGIQSAHSAGMYVVGVGEPAMFNPIADDSVVTLTTLGPWAAGLKIAYGTTGD